MIILSFCLVNYGYGEHHKGAIERQEISGGRIPEKPTRRLWKHCYIEESLLILLPLVCDLPGCFIVWINMELKIKLFNQYKVIQVTDDKPFLSGLIHSGARPYFHCFSVIASSTEQKPWNISGLWPWNNKQKTKTVCQLKEGTNNALRI